MSRLFAVGGPVLAGLGAALDGGHMDGPRATLVLLVASCLAWPGRAALGLGLVGLASVMAPEAVADGTANGWSAAGLVAVCSRRPNIGLWIYLPVVAGIAVAVVTATRLGGVL